MQNTWRRCWLARLPQSASLEDPDTRTPRGLDQKLLAMLTALAWIKDKLDVLISGPCGVGKSFIASTFAHAACRADYSVRSYRLAPASIERTFETRLRDARSDLDARKHRADRRYDFASRNRYKTALSCSVSIGLLR